MNQGRDAGRNIDGMLFQGSRLRMTAAVHDDAAVIANWYDRENFARSYDSGPAKPMTANNIRNAWSDFINSDTNYQFAFRPLQSDEIIVLIQLDGIQWTHRTSFCSIAVNPSFQGRGYGMEAMQLALNYAFRELNLHAVRLTVFSYNVRAIALYEKLGFQREGTYREHLLRDGERFDMYLYGLLQREWAHSKYAQPSVPDQADQARPAQVTN